MSIPPAPGQAQGPAIHVQGLEKSYKELRVLRGRRRDCPGQRCHRELEQFIMVADTTRPRRRRRCGRWLPCARAADLAVLGYMAELGEHERTGHEQVCRLAAEEVADWLRESTTEPAGDEVVAR